MEFQKELLEQFETQIQGINVKDFGDFRRLANTYLYRLTEKLSSEKAQPILKELKTLINDKPNWQMEPTRRKALNLTQELRKTLDP